MGLRLDIGSGPDQIVIRRVKPRYTLKDMFAGKISRGVGRRPALVVSSGMFTAFTGLAVACPLTSRVRPFPSSPTIRASVVGEVLISHIRGIDTLVRPVTYMGATVAASLADEARGKLAACFSI